MNLKARILIVILIVIILSGCDATKLLSAELTNVSPAKIEMNNATYILTDEILPNTETEKQIGKITKVNKLVSYLEGQEPYKNPNRIYKVKGISSEDVIAVEVNGEIYKAKAKE